MSSENPRRGKVTIAPDVLITIARLSALSVPGVARMSSAPVAVDRLFQRHANNEGVRIEVRQHSVVVDLHLVVNHIANVREVSRAVQTEVARAIQDMTGMQVLAVNVSVDDVAFAEVPSTHNS